MHHLVTGCLTLAAVFHLGSKKGGHAGCAAALSQPLPAFNGLPREKTTCVNLPCAEHLWDYSHLQMHRTSRNRKLLLMSQSIILS